MLEKLPDDHYTHSAPGDWASSVINIHDYSSLNRKYIGSVVRVNIEIEPHKVFNKNLPRCYYYKFKCGKIKWFLCVFPFGVNEANNVNTSIFLIKKSVTSPYCYSTIFTFDYGNEEPHFFNFSSGEDSCGLINWKIKDWTNGLRARFVLLCDVDQFNDVESAVEKRIKKYYVERESNVESKYRTYSDLFNNLKVSEPLLSKQDVNSLDVNTHLISKMFDYLDSKDLMIDMELALTLSPIARSYSLHDLHVICEIILFLDVTKDELNSINFNITNLAFKYNMPFLQVRCIDVIVINLKTFMKSENWLSLFTEDTGTSFVDCFTRSITLVKEYNGLKNTWSTQLPQADKIITFPTSNETVICSYDTKMSKYTGSTISFKANIGLSVCSNFKYLYHDFQTGDLKWKLVIVPSATHISVYLANNSINGSDERVRAYFTFNTSNHFIYSHCFSKDASCAILENWKKITKKTIHFTFTLMCLTQEDSKIHNEVNHNLVYKQFDHVKFSTMCFEKPDDIQLIGDGWLYRINKEVFMEISSVSNAMLSHDFKEKLENTVKIPNVSSEAMKAILSFIYTGRITINEEIAVEIGHFADIYGINTLKTAFQHASCYFLKEETVISYMNLASLFNMPILKRKCLEYIGDKFKTFIQSDSWKELTSDPTSVRDLYEELSTLYRFNLK